MGLGVLESQMMIHCLFLTPQSLMGSFDLTSHTMAALSQGITSPFRAKQTKQKVFGGWWWEIKA